MTTSPGGAIVICEDGNLKSNFIRALLPDNTLITIAENLVGRADALPRGLGQALRPDRRRRRPVGRRWHRALGVRGPDLQPDGQWLFVNIQVPGITCAITGPWGDLGL